MIEVLNSPVDLAKTEAFEQSVQLNMNSYPTPLIQLEDISKVFLTDDIETHALAGLHLEIYEGEFLSVAGPSGCGKSTLLGLIGLLDEPTSGFYRLDGRETSSLKANERARLRNESIGFIFQSFNLIGEMSVFENVELPLTYRQMPARERHERVQRALSKVDMGHRQSHLPSQLSGGQQQRVAVARALAGEPAILLADEPTGNLDSKNGQLVMDLLQELSREGTTICMVTHNEVYAQCADRIVHLFDGRIVNEVKTKSG